jgi:HEPN domain-containing protein
MNASEHHAEARRWIRYAEEDLSAAEVLLAPANRIARQACWLAQQAAEKALKAGLVFGQIPFPFRHDLDALRNLLPGDWETRRQNPDLAELTEWAVEARYPGDWQEPLPEDALRAVAQARGVLENMLADLARHGLDTRPER